MIKYMFEVQYVVIIIKHIYVYIFNKQNILFNNYELHNFYFFCGEHFSKIPGAISCICMTEG